MNETTKAKVTHISNKKPFIQFQQVTKKFDDFTAINNITLDIYNNEFFSLLGPSGCGKTTLLRMLAGFEKPTDGRILLDGEDITDIPPHLRPINMMFQSYALFPHMTVEKNIAFGLKQDKLPSNKVNQRVDEMLDLVELTEFAKRKPNQLSGGQCQRVALARSLAKHPKLLLLDEPLGALDKRLRDQTQFELMNIQEKLGITFVIVTHDQEEAMTVSNRIGVMDKGKVIQVATPNHIYEAPATKSVAEFIGNVNLFAGIYKGFNDTGSKLQCEHSDAVVYSSQSIDVDIGANIWLAVRPEKLEISKTIPDSEYNILKGQVIDIGYGGSFSTYHVKLPNGNMLSAIRANRERTSEHSITWNDDVYLHWSAKSAIVLTN